MGFSIFWIKFRTLTSCDRFTAECTPGMLKLMFSSLIARLNSFSVSNDAMSRFSSGAICSFTVCALERFCSTSCPVPSWACLTRMFPDNFSSFTDLSLCCHVSPSITENFACWTSPQDYRQSWSCFNEIFGGGRGDMCDFSYKTSPVFNLTTFGITSWKCSLKDNCIGSCLMECQSLSDRKIDINPNTASWCFFQALCTYCARRGTRIFMIFVSGINGQEEHCLSSARTSRYQSNVDDRVKIERTSNVVDMIECSTLNNFIVLQRRINELMPRVSLKSTR